MRDFDVRELKICCNFNETHVSFKDKDDQLNEFLSSLGSDPSSPLLQDFDFTSGKFHRNL